MKLTKKHIGMIAELKLPWSFEPVFARILDIGRSSFSGSQMVTLEHPAVTNVFSARVVAVRHESGRG